MFGLVDRGNKNNLNSVWVMFGYYRNYLVPIGKKLKTNEKLKRRITNPNRIFNGTHEPRAALTSQDHLCNTKI